ncbi:MAG: hypothetical protein ABL994_25095 [Verrucomicrobiales bacterium]
MKRKTSEPEFIANKPTACKNVRPGIRRNGHPVDPGTPGAEDSVLDNDRKGGPPSHRSL